MKVNINFTLDIDQVAWAEEYGLELSEVRDDVKLHAENGVVAHFLGLGLLNET